jgi:hypothetical protein
MLRTAAIVFLLTFSLQAAQPIIDNERVTVWDTTGKLPPAAHDFIAVPLNKKGTAVLGHKGEAPGADNARTIVIELKDHPVAPLANKTGLPNAFPRPHVKKLLENDRVIVWSYHWNPGEPTPMHFMTKTSSWCMKKTPRLSRLRPMEKKQSTNTKTGRRSSICGTGRIRNC